MDSSSPKPIAETPDENSHNDSPKSKFQYFIQDNKKILSILGIIIGIVLFAVLLYTAFFYESKIERFANQFCTCSENSKSDFYNYSKDGFGYKSDLSTCFGMEFSAYGQDYDKVTKRILLEDFKEAVINKCPEKLEEVFEYQ
ncbi:MAG: hypothetical protein ACRBFS_11205 [Aureispira sp.]